MPLAEPKEREKRATEGQGVVNDLIEMLGEAASVAGREVLDIVKSGLAIPPPAVRLTDRTFNRMNSGESGLNIVQGDGGLISIGDNNSNEVKSKNDRSEKLSPFDPQILREIVAALRAEAPGATRLDRIQIRRIATELEEAADEATPNEIAVVEAMTTAQKIISGATAVFVASGAAVKAWFELTTGGS